MFLQAIAVSVGGALGALSRWALGLLMNDIFPDIPPGTMFVNIFGGYLAGLLFALFLQNPHFAPEWKLLAITGFLGGLTTFSAFTMDVMALFQAGRVALGFAAIFLHVGGSLAAMMLGMLTHGFFLRIN